MALSTRLGIAAALLALATGCDNERTIIVVADAGNGRIVQMDDFSGAGWTTFAYPRVRTGVIAPTGVAVDSLGRIYAVNTADNTISRMDDISGAGFVAFGRGGSGVGEFNGPFGIAIDAEDRIYVADA